MYNSIGSKQCLGNVLSCLVMHDVLYCTLIWTIEPTKLGGGEKKITQKQAINALYNYVIDQLMVAVGYLVC